MNNFGIIPEDRPQTYTRDEAEKQCKINFGPEFNLATFADQNELDTVTEILKNNAVNYHAYWTGYTDYNGVLEGICNIIYFSMILVLIEYHTYQLNDSRFNRTKVDVV